MLRILLIVSFSLLAAGCKLGSGGSLFSDAAGSANSFAGGGGGASLGAGIATYSNPEPSSLVLLGIGLGGLVLAAFKKKKKS